MRRTKEMRKLRKLTKFGKVVKDKSADIKSYGGTVGSVHLQWEMNDLAKRDQVFKMEVGDEVAYIDYQEFMHYARALNKAVDVNG